jgi:hypothetical protein
LGVTEQERQRRWDITNRIATACMSVSIFGMLCVFVPFIAKFAAGLLVVIPWVVLTNMRLHGVYFSGSPKKTPVVGNSVALFGAGAGLGIFGFLYPTMVINHQKALQFFPPDAAHALYLIVGPLCGLVLVVATLIVIFSAPQMKASSARYAAIFVLVPLILLVDWGYGIGAALEFDAVFDRANLWFKP